MPRLRLTPLGLALGFYRIWRRLPPAQRALLLQAAVRQGPRVAKAMTARRRMRPPRM